MNVVLVITDGKSNVREELLPELAQRLKSVARVVAIGVGNRVDFDELQTIASTACDVHTVANFDLMDEDMNKTMDQLCGCQ